MSRLLYNREYFGYIVGFPSGDILLTRESAGTLLRAGCSLSDLEPYLLEELEIVPNFHLNTPLLVWVELTRKCNLRCKHCYITGGDVRERELPTAAFIEILDELAEMGVWAVAFTGGEPTLHPDFVKIVSHAHERGLLIGIATNGLLLTSELLDALPRQGVIISVSIDDLHVGSQGQRNEFAIATNAITRAQQLGFHTNIMTNTHRQNISHLDNLVMWAKANGVSIRSVPFSPLGRGKQYRHEYENTVDDVEVAARFWLRECEWEHEYHRRVGLCVGAIFNYGLSLGYMTRSCSSGRYLAYISADGTLYPCTMCAGEAILSPGQIRGRGFADIWRDHWEIRDHNWDRFKQHCSECIVGRGDYYCASRCPAMSHARNGTYNDCGASHFEKVSTVYRTAMLQASPLAPYTGQPVVAVRWKN